MQDKSKAESAVTTASPSSNPGAVQRSSGWLRGMSYEDGASALAPVQKKDGDPPQKTTVGGKKHGPPEWTLVSGERELIQHWRKIHPDEPLLEAEFADVFAKDPAENAVCRKTKGVGRSRARAHGWSWVACADQAGGFGRIREVFEGRFVVLGREEAEGDALGQFFGRNSPFVRVDDVRRARRGVRPRRSRAAAPAREARWFGRLGRTTCPSGRPRGWR